MGLAWFNMVWLYMCLHVVPTQIELSRPRLHLWCKRSISKHYTCTTVNPILLVSIYLHTEFNCKYNLFLSKLKKILLAVFLRFLTSLCVHANRGYCSLSVCVCVSALPITGDCFLTAITWQAKHLAAANI